VEVEVSGATVKGVFASWGKVRTDRNGNFTLGTEKSEAGRWIRVKALSEGSDLRVSRPLLSGSFGKDWYTVFETSEKRDGPRIDIGTRTFRRGAGGELGEEDNYRAAAT
jgi:hypothetical protein